MDHVEEKRQAHHWKQEKNVQHYLACRLGNRFSQEEVDHVVGVLEVNAFEVTSRDGHRGRGLYPLTALMSHSCLSNTRYVFSNNFIRSRRQKEQESNKKLSKVDIGSYNVRQMWRLLECSVKAEEDVQRLNARFVYGNVAH